MSGFSDDFYRQMTAFYQDGRTLDVPKPYYRTGPFVGLFVYVDIRWVGG